MRNKLLSLTMAGLRVAAAMAAALGAGLIFSLPASAQGLTTKLGVIAPLTSMSAHLGVADEPVAADHPVRHRQAAHGPIPAPDRYISRAAPREASNLFVQRKH